MAAEEWLCEGARMATNVKNGKRKKRWIFGSLGLVVLLLLVAGVTAALRPKHDIDPEKLATVEKGDIARSVVATGKIEPLTQVEVKSKASGIVEKIYVDYGESVKAGQVLVQLDKEQLEANVRESSANLDAAKAALE